MTTIKNLRDAPALYRDVEVEFRVHEMLEHIGRLDDQHIREAITTLLNSLEDQTPILTKSDAQKIADLPSLDRDKFLADLHLEILLVKGWWP